MGSRRPHFQESTHLTRIILGLYVVQTLFTFPSKIEATTLSNHSRREKCVFQMLGYQIPPIMLVMVLNIRLLSNLYQEFVLARPISYSGSHLNTHYPSQYPIEDHPLATHREPSALYCWILEILCCNLKGRRALLRIPSAEGRSVYLCWAPSKPEEPASSGTPPSELRFVRQS